MLGRRRPPAAASAVLGLEAFRRTRRAKSPRWAAIPTCGSRVRLHRHLLPYATAWSVCCRRCAAPTPYWARSAPAYGPHRPAAPLPRALRHPRLQRLVAARIAAWHAGVEALHCDLQRHVDHRHGARHGPRAPATKPATCSPTWMPRARPSPPRASWVDGNSRPSPAMGHRPATPDDLRSVLRAGALALPGFADAGGPYASHRGRLQAGTG